MTTTQQANTDAMEALAEHTTPELGQIRKMAEQAENVTVLAWVDQEIARREGNLDPDYADFRKKHPECWSVVDGVELHHSPCGGVSWASDWSRIWDLPLRREFGGPSTYGHVTFYIETIGE